MLIENRIAQRAARPAGGLWMNRRVLILAIVGSILFVAVVVAVAGSMTYWFGLNRPVTNAGSAQTLCENAVRHDLLAPLNATFHETHAKLEHMSEDDDVRLGFDAANVKEVWAVDGEVESPGTNGDLARSGFTCRAYLIDGQSPRTYLRHDTEGDAGQWTYRP